MERVGHVLKEPQGPSLQMPAVAAKVFPKWPLEQQHPGREWAPTGQQRAPGGQIGTLRSHEGRNKGSREVPARQSSGLGTREPGGRTSVFQACGVSWSG